MMVENVVRLPLLVEVADEALADEEAANGVAVFPLCDEVAVLASLTAVVFAATSGVAERDD